MTEDDDVIRLRVHISEEMAETIDALRGREKGIPSRSEYVRRVVLNHLESSRPALRVNLSGR